DHHRAGDVQQRLPSARARLPRGAPPPVRRARDRPHLRRSHHRLPSGDGRRAGALRRGARPGRVREGARQRSPDQRAGRTENPDAADRRREGHPRGNAQLGGDRRRGLARHARRAGTGSGPCPPLPARGAADGRPSGRGARDRPRDAGPGSGPDVPRRVHDARPREGIPRSLRHRPPQVRRVRRGASGPRRAAHRTRIVVCFGGAHGGRRRPLPPGRPRGARRDETRVKKRVLLAGIFHETHTFLEDRTRLEQFEVLREAELLSARGDASPLGGIVEFAASAGWELLPAIDLRAVPSGTVEDRVVEVFWEEFRRVALRERPRGVDGICLILHGAMVSESFVDVEGELLGRIRRLEGFETTPLTGVLDLHANTTPRMAEAANGLIAYRENPHADARAAALDGARLLDRLMTAGERSVTVWDHPPIVWPPLGTGTAQDPMKTLEAMAREIERSHPEILAVNVF